MGLWILLLLFKQYPVKVLAAGLAHGQTVVKSFIFTFLTFPENDRKVNSELLFDIFFPIGTACSDYLSSSRCVCVCVFMLSPIFFHPSGECFDVS